MFIMIVIVLLTTFTTYYNNRTVCIYMSYLFVNLFLIFFTYDVLSMVCNIYFEL